MALHYLIMGLALGSVCGTISFFIFRILDGSFSTIMFGPRKPNPPPKPPLSEVHPAVYTALAPLRWAVMAWAGVMMVFVLIGGPAMLIWRAIVDPSIGMFITASVFVGLAGIIGWTFFSKKDRRCRSPAPRPAARRA